MDIIVESGGISSGRIALVANEVSTVTFADNISRAAVYKLSGTGDVWFTTDGTTPVPDGQNSYPLPDAGSIGVDDGRETINTPNGDVVKLVSTGAPTVIVVKA